MISCPSRMNLSHSRRLDAEIVKSTSHVPQAFNTGPHISEIIAPTGYSNCTGNVDGAQYMTNLGGSAVSPFSEYPHICRSSESRQLAKLGQFMTHQKLVMVFQRFLNRFEADLGQPCLGQEARKMLSWSHPSHQ